MDNSVGMKDFSASIESTNVPLVTVEVETIKIPVRDINSMYIYTLYILQYIRIKMRYISGVTVEFEKDVYSVSEKNGTVNVCVSLVSSADCPVAFDFDVLLSTIDDSASKIILIVHLFFKLCSLLCVSIYYSSGRGLYGYVYVTPISSV